MRTPLSSGKETVPPAVSGVLAYRCNNGHIFMFVDEAAQTAKRGAGG
jgi:hypothetical protein